MRALYGRHYAARYHALATIIPDNASVLDVCCGPPIFYKRFLKAKNVSYIGVDINERFVQQVRNSGAEGMLMDLRDAQNLPLADVVIMQASLYHFLPDPSPIVDSMLAAARETVIVSEPIKNFARSRIPIIAGVARSQTDPGVGGNKARFNEGDLDRFFAAYEELLERTMTVPGGREKVYVLNAARSRL